MLTVLSDTLTSPGTPLIALVVVAAQVATAIALFVYLIRTFREY